jgi:hypothetical protein
MMHWRHSGALRRVSAHPKADTQFNANRLAAAIQAEATSAPSTYCRFGARTSYSAASGSSSAPVMRRVLAWKLK